MLGLLFWAPWSAPCKIWLSILKSLVEEMNEQSEGRNNAVANGHNHAAAGAGKGIGGVSGVADKELMIVLVPSGGSSQT